ncbi:NAD-dependent epimerase/dehydratase family protein [Polynucleobacter sp. MWH-UH23A]|uniref:NAD-dependent epimerase/dehydratase family protein n=1 Tax=Polynucleobacter sp. MWH-UH23A TaxID=1855613 RepID=UPI003364E883
MNIVVTGSTGFLGKFLIKKLELSGHKITALSSKNCDLKTTRILDQINQKFDLVIHLAAWTQAGDFCLNHPGEQWIKNQQINTNILDWWLRDQPQAKFVSIGTSCSYDPNLPLVEENYLIGQPIDSLYTYAMTKRMLQIGVESLHKQFGLEYLTVVPSTLYGPMYHTDGRQMHFIFDLIRKIICGKFYDDKVELWGNGYQEREVIYIDDFIDDFQSLLTGGVTGIVNIGSGNSIKIRDFANIISKILDYDPDNIIYDPNKYVGAKSKLLEISKLKGLLGSSFYRTDLDAGIQNTIDWFLENTNTYSKKS